MVDALTHAHRQEAKALEEERRNRTKEMLAGWKRAAEKTPHQKQQEKEQENARVLQEKCQASAKRNYGVR